MTWDDEPSEMQLGTIFSWLRWCVDRQTASDAVNWLQQNATRRDVSYEMTRLKGLKEKHRLDGSTCFKSDIWEGFEHE